MKGVTKKGIMLRRACNTPKILKRNELDKKRRMYMKDLYAKLALVIPASPLKSSSHMLLEYAATHIKNLQQRLDSLKQKKLLLGSRSRSPVMLVRELGSTLEVFLMNGLNKCFFLHEVIRVLEEEAAQVVNVNQSTGGDRNIYTIYCKAVSSRIGIETSRVRERLEELIS